MNMLQDAQKKMQHTKCECGSTKIEMDPRNFAQICAECGIVIEHSVMLTSTSCKGASGDLEKQGTVVNMRSTVNFDRDAPGFSNANSLFRKEKKMRTKLQYIVSQLDGDHPQFSLAIDNALRIWRLCVDKQLTRGYVGEHLAAILFYMACRQMQPPLPYLLLDFAAICEINVYKLASKFGKLCRDIPIDINSLTDPSIYIARFAQMLEFEAETETITATACKLVDQMKKDWITTGRRPSGVCGAALLIAARMHGFKRSIKEIVAVVNLSEATIKKRVTEFLDTKIAGMTVDTFRSTSRNEINENANLRKLEEQERPPVIKEQEKSVVLMKKKEEIELKRKEEIAEFDRKYDEENGVQREQNCFSLDGILKAELTQSRRKGVVFVPAMQSDDDIINGIGINGADSTTTDPESNGGVIEQKQSGCGKREMDATSSDEIESAKEFDTACIESARDVITYITSATRTDIVSGGTCTEDIDINGGTSFIVGANATQLDEYDGCDNEDIDVDGDKEKKFKYYEDHDLSHLDNDLEVKSMLLNEDESNAKNKMFLVCNPDWIKVKKDIDRRHMVKEEKERSRKRKLGQSYKDDPYAFMAGKVSKRFRSEKLNLDMFHKLMGNQQTPEITIKKQDPLL